MIRLGTIVLGAEDVDRAVSFWSSVLAYRPVQFPDAADDFTILLPPSGEGTRVALHRADTPAQERPRVHLDLVVDDAAEQAKEIERLISLGASRRTCGSGRQPLLRRRREPRLGTTRDAWQPC